MDWTNRHNPNRILFLLKLEEVQEVSAQFRFGANTGVAYARATPAVLVTHAQKIHKVRLTNSLYCHSFLIHL